ncbi:YqaJ viral recombinase family protein [Comamonas aquatica]|uniref:YqaJ viral recombinase family protein n=1 Tax=Comamonas aquatica TaxID=225991 RepID=UPI002448AD68|nr:YqaJ viral recombinase family protein [Comamonas aquatica]MDH1673969.1 YqaJ viral recombinase family protein [Comamonas aquatica]MDH1677169.1 YqaJ viral recombinase family protein [Comamonas aquatica]
MSMQTVSLVQGSPEWHAHRAHHFNASDAPAMMGCSSYKSRSQLIKELATGLTGEVDPATQRRFDDGHRFEALARPLAEEIISEPLSPCVGVNGMWSASFDGLTFMHDAAFEHKTLNNTLREVMLEGCTGADLPLMYQVQMEHQAMVSGCKRILFMTSEWGPGGDLIEMRYCWYEPDAELRAQIIAGWEQLEKDVAAYDPAAERTAPAVAAPIESLPAVVVQVQGALTVTGNLDAFGDALRQFIGRMPTKPATDQDFADLEAGSKALKKVEDALDAAEDGALAQISPVEQMRRIKADLKNLARTTRLVWDKLVSAEKDRLRTALVTGAQTQLDQHIQALNQRLGANWLPRIAGGFAETIKGLKSLDSMRDKVAVALTNAKHDANQQAYRLEVNREHLVQEDGDWIALFADFSTVGAKAEEDFQALASLRIGSHKQAEAARLDKERERIRAEEAARLAREAAAKAQQDAEQERLRIQQQAQQEQAEIAKAQQAGTLAAPVAQDLAGLVQDKAVEGVAGIDAQEAIAAAQTSAAADDGQTMTLGQLNARMEGIGLGKISAATLEHHGIPFTKERAAVQITSGNARRLMLLLSMGYRKLADELQAVAA